MTEKDTLFRLVVANPEEEVLRNHLTFSEWGSALTLDQYLERERQLKAHPHSRTSMITWLLKKVDTVLSSCETYQQGKNAAFASVYTEKRYRGQGHASQMMSLVMRELEKKEIETFTLYSEVGPEIYGRLGFKAVPSFERILRPDLNSSLRLSSNTQFLTTSQVMKKFEKWAKKNKPDSNSAFPVIPDQAQLDWHFERERVYSKLLKKPQPRFAGAQCGDSFIAWHQNYKDNRLVVLFLATEAASDLDALVLAALQVAREQNLDCVEIWEVEAVSDWSSLTLPCERIERAEKLAMIRGRGDQDVTSYWKLVSRSSWV